MQQLSFKTFFAAFSLFFFLATPLSVFAQCGPNGCGPGAGAGAGTGAGAGGIDPLMLMLLLRGGNGAGGGGGGATGQVGQALTLAGALTGNMGLLMVGMLMSMLGGLTGGATPQRGNPDEQYVGQGQSYGNGGGGRGGIYDPYYPTPTPNPNGPTPTPSASACSASIFIVKDSTVTPNVTKPYPATATISQNNCVLAINTDNTAAGVTIQPTSGASGAALAITQVAAKASHIFRFPAKNTYKFCIGSAASSCTTVTVQ